MEILPSGQEMKPEASRSGCSYCTKGFLQFSTINHDEPKEEESYLIMKKVFHEDCASSHEITDDECLLCGFCRHLRLTHLLRCLGKEKLPFESVRFCRFEDFNLRQECAFCRLIIRSGLPYSIFAGIGLSTNYDGSSLEISFYPGSILPRIRYRDRGWETSRRVYYEDRKNKSWIKEKGDLDEVNEMGFLNRVKKIKFLDKKNKMESSESSNRMVSSMSDRTGRRKIGAYVDWAFLKGRLEHCYSEHPSCAPSSFGIWPAQFRIIDVHRRRIVSADSESRYVALSYVWGNNQDRSKMTLQSTLGILEQDHALISSRTSKTVDDAIRACCLLKEDYLWVDQYCIIQDDEIDKLEQVSAMSTIYSSAVFVMIVTDGDMNDGFPGMSYKRPQTQVQLQLAGLSFINEIPSLQEVVGGQSVWSTRGWTYQEMALTRRKLYFTGSQSFFECSDSVWHEDGSEEQEIWTPNTLRPPFWVPYIDYFYNIHVGKYLFRKLGSGSDIYYAIEGIASALYKERTPLWYGLPRKEFDKALVWCPNAIDSDNNIDGIPIMRNVPKSLTPSWSWSSTRQNFVLLDDDSCRQLRYCGTLVVWASYKQTNDSFRMESIIPSLSSEFGCPHRAGGGRDSYLERTAGTLRARSLKKNNRDSYEGACYVRDNDECLPFMALAWSQGCVEADYPFELHGNTTYPCLKACIATRWPCHYMYWQEAFQSQGNSETGSTFLQSLSREINDRMNLSILQSSPNIISTRAQSALFRLNPPDNRLHDYPIIDDQNHMIGLLIGKDFKLQAALSASIERREKFEFIALSVSTNDEVIQYDATVEGGSFRYSRASELVDGGSKSDLTYYDKDGTALIPLPVVNVMLVRWNGRLAHRVSIGWIYLTKWTKAQPRFKLILLE